MATRILCRSLLSATKLNLPISLRRSNSSLSLPSSTLFRLRSLAAVSSNLRHFAIANSRGFATRQSTSSLSDPNPNWSNRPPKETILLDGCDFEHWLVVMDKPEGDPTRDDIIDSYIKTLAKVIGSEEEARFKIYSVSTRHYYAFGALVSEELSYKLKELPGVRWVLPDSYLDVKNKDYGGEPFINGQAVPYDPKYHEEWVRNNARANERNRRNDRPRNYDRARNFDRPRNRFNQPNVENSGPNMGGGSTGGMGAPPGMGGGPQSSMGGAPTMGNMPPRNMGGPNMGGMPPNMGGAPNVQPNNMGGAPNMQPNNMGGPNMGGVPPNMGGVPNMQLNNMGGAPNMQPNNMGGPNMGGMSPNGMGGGRPNMGGMPQTSMGGAPNTGGTPPPYTGGFQQNNRGVPQNNMGGPPNSPPHFQYGNGPNDGGARFQSGPGPNQYSYAPNAPPGGNSYQGQDVPGRDMPPYPNNQ